MIVLFLLLTADWKKEIESDGVTLYQRPCRDSAFDDYKLTTTSPISAEIIADTLWDHRAYPSTMPFVRAIKILAEADNERYAYLEIAMPVLKDRDYCIRYYRAGLTFSSHIDDSGCPPEKDQYVRMHRQDTTWTLTPLPEGGTRVVYEVQSDLGGAVPALMVNIATGKEHVKFFKAVLAAAQRRSPRGVTHGR